MHIISGQTLGPGEQAELRGSGHRGHSQSGQQPLKAIRQMPQFSSLATQSQVATPFQHLIFTFMAAGPVGEGREHLATRSLQSSAPPHPRTGAARSPGVCARGARRGSPENPAAAESRAPRGAGRTLRPKPTGARRLLEERERAPGAFQRAGLRAATDGQRPRQPGPGKPPRARPAPTPGSPQAGSPATPAVQPARPAPPGEEGTGRGGARPRPNGRAALRPAPSHLRGRFARRPARLPLAAPAPAREGIKTTAASARHLTAAPLKRRARARTRRTAPLPPPARSQSAAAPRTRHRKAPRGAGSDAPAC